MVDKNVKSYNCTDTYFTVVRLTLRTSEKFYNSDVDLLNYFRNRFINPKISL